MLRDIPSIKGIGVSRISGEINACHLSHSPEDLGLGLMLIGLLGGSGDLVSR